MKCILIEPSRTGWSYTITVETKWFWIFKSKRKFMTIRPLSSERYEWMEMPNGNKVSEELSSKLDAWVKDYKQKKS